MSQKFHLTLKFQAREFPIPIVSNLLQQTGWGGGGDYVWPMCVALLCNPGEGGISNRCGGGGVIISDPCMWGCYVIQGVCLTDVGGWLCRGGMSNRCGRGWVMSGPCWGGIDVWPKWGFVGVEVLNFQPREFFPKPPPPDPTPTPIGLWKDNLHFVMWSVGKNTMW